MISRHLFRLILANLILSVSVSAAYATPTVTRLTPPSELFSSGVPDPVVARFLPGQRFDLQATIRPDAPTRTIEEVNFVIDGKAVNVAVALRDCASGCMDKTPANTTIATVRAVSVDKPGMHIFLVKARQSDGQTVTAGGNFEVVAIEKGGTKIRNIIILLGDGMGAAHRTAARIVASGYAQGKARSPLAMDTLPVTGMVRTSSLNSIVTDSSPGMSSYVSGNKNNNNQEGVFPDDTIDPFDNPRIEYLSEYMHRTRGTVLGLVTTSDVFDATPAANAIHTASRGAGTGIVDQYLDDRDVHGLRVLMGGGRKWFLPEGAAGSARASANDYAFSATDPHTADIVKRWKAAPGALDAGRNLIADFESKGFQYVATRKEMNATGTARADRLLGLFALSNMNVALDKINGRRGDKSGVSGGSVVDDFGLADQPMLDEMSVKALDVLSRHKQGFVLMIEGASIDKQSHALDNERWILDTIEFDRAVKVARDFAQRSVATHPPAQRVGKAADAERPDIGELRLVIDLAGHHDHRRLQFVHRLGKQAAIGDARLLAQIGGAHFPFPPQHAQHRLGVNAEAPLLVRPAHAVDRVKIRDHPRRQEHRLAARQLGVVHLVAPDDLVLQQPRQ